MLNLISFKFNQYLGKDTKDDCWYQEAVLDCVDGIWEADLEADLLYISPKLLQLIGYETEDKEKLGNFKNWIDCIHLEDIGEISERFERFKKTTNLFLHFDGFRFKCKDGDYIWLESQTKCARNEAGNIMRMCGIVYNVTPHKYLHRQMRTIISEQDKAAQSRMKFISTLNHELRSPLSGIIGMISLLEETDLGEEQKRYLENIGNSSQILLTLINDILDISKLNSGKFEFEKIPFSPVTVLKQVSELIRPSLLKKKLTFNALMDRQVPETLIGDPTRLQQILINLLTNAVKFTHEGRIDLTLKAKAGPIQTEAGTFYDLSFEVSDTGIGIPLEAQDKLFQDYSQVDASITRRYGGTGLGLSICKDLVHLMGGEIGITSESGKGSTFWFEIQFESQQNALPEEKPLKLEQEPQKLQNYPKLKILLVEDNQINQEVMVGLLKLAGDEIVIANNGQEAVELFEKDKFDIIFMDVNMPILDGLQATRIIRQLPHGNIPIIAVTANTFTGDRENCLINGMTDVLTKPINKEILHKILDSYRFPILPELSFPEEIGIDKLIVENLVKDLGADRLEKLMKLYKTEGESHIHRMKEENGHNMKALAHTIAGMSENLGVRGVGKIARTIMKTYDTEKEKIPVLVAHMEHSFHQSLQEMHLFLDSEK